MKADKRLNRTVLEVVENQIRQLNPPATKEFFDRLICRGYDHDKVRRLNQPRRLATLLVVETIRVVAVEEKTCSI